MAEFKSDNSSKRVAKNGVFVGLSFVVYTLSSFLFIPFLVKHYGTGSYGLIALAGFLTQYVGLVSSCVGSAIARFLNVALNKGDWKQATEIFSTALAANMALLLIQVPVFALGIWKLEWLMEFPPEIATDFRILVSCNVITFLISSVVGVLLAPLQAANRVDIGSKINIVRQIAQVVLLVIFITLYGPKLWIIGCVDLGLSVIRAFVGYALYRKFANDLVFKVKSITRKWVKPVLEMAWWMLAFSLGQAFFVKTDVWVVNRFITAEMAGVYAALLVWANFLRQIGNQMEVLVIPVYMIDYAKGNYARIAESCRFLVRTLSFFAAISGGAVCGCAALILRLWLGEEFVKYVPLLWSMVIYVVLTLNKAVTWPIFPAFNKTKQLGITTLVCGALNLLLSIAFVFLGWGAIGVSAATLLSLFLLFGILYPWHVSKIIEIRFKEFLVCHVQTVVIFLLIAIPIAFVISLPLALIYQLTISFCIIGIGLLVIWKAGYRPAEKERMLLALAKVKEKISRVSG